MALDPSSFETIVPSQYISFTIPNPLTHHHRLHTPLLQVAVLDSPSQLTHPPRVAAMIVPLRRESDWIFSTVSGHLQLLLGSGDTSRFILIGNIPVEPHPVSFDSRSDDLDPELEETLLPLVISLSPKLGFNNVSDFPKIPFLSYDDGVISSVVVELCMGPRVGSMLVEDVELEILDEFGCRSTEFRRRLRFKRTPNLIQTQVRISRDLKSCKNELSIVNSPSSDSLDTAILVQPYLIPMVAGISLVGSSIENKFRNGSRPKALCLGVGGGALLSFLNNQLGFEVVGVEEDKAVLGLARRRFGLPENPYIHIHIGNGIELVKNESFLEKNDCVFESKFDVVMVDLDSSEVGIGTMAPTMEFVEESVLVATSGVLCKSGIVVVNVIPSSRLSYDKLVADFKYVFDEVYEIDVGNGENCVLIASVTRISNVCRDSETSFVCKLRKAISGSFMDSIRKI